MKTFCLLLFCIGSVFANDLFDLDFSLEDQKVKLTVTTIEDKPNLAPLILLDKYFDQEKGEIYLSITEDREAMSAQVFGKRRGTFFFQKNEEIFPRIYHLIINQKAYGELYILDKEVLFIPTMERYNDQ